MKLKTITLSRTQNTGNYSSRRFEATVELEAGDVGSAAVQRLRRFVDASLDSFDVSEADLRAAKRVFDEAHAALDETKIFDAEKLGARCVPDEEYDTEREDR